MQSFLDLFLKEALVCFQDMEFIDLLVSNSEMKYIENQDLKDKLIDLYDFKFKRYENIDPIITNLYQYGFGNIWLKIFHFIEEKI